MRKLFCAAAAFVLTLTLAACSGEAREVPVERVDMLTAASFAEDRYAGIVVSENVTKITRDLDKTIENVYVTEGSEVKAGTKLFSYDSEALRLELDRQKLELEKMKNENTNYTSQLKDLNSQLSKTSDESVKAQLNLQIKTIENEQNQLKYDIEAKNREIEQLNTSLKNVTITSPVEGTVRKIDETDTTAYITIQQAGAYRIKGSLNELSMQGGITVGASVQAVSRVDENQTWNGTVTSIDTENMEDDAATDGYWHYGYADAMTTSTSYYFYVDLEDTEGLLLGQHVYIRLAGSAPTDGVWVPASYLMDLTTDEETYELTASVWRANEEDKLERQDVTLGAYDELTNSYEVISGLSNSDFVADPTASGCEAGAKVSYREVTDFTGTETTGAADETGDDAEDDDVTDDGAADEGSDAVVPVPEVPTDGTVGG